MNLEIAFRLHLYINTPRENLGEEAMETRKPSAQCPHHFTQILHSFFRNQEAFSIKNRTWKIHKASKETYDLRSFNQVSCETVKHSPIMLDSLRSDDRRRLKRQCPQTVREWKLGIKNARFLKLRHSALPESSGEVSARCEKWWYTACPSLSPGFSLAVFRAAPQLTERLEEVPCS